MSVLTVAIVYAGFSLIILLIAALGLDYFLALSAPPSRRAAWVAITAYLSAVVILLTGGITEFYWLSPLSPIPAALVIFFWYRSRYRRAWVEHEDDLGIDETLANDDWKAGVFKLAAAIVAAAGYVVIKYFVVNHPL